MDIFYEESSVAHNARKGERKYTIIHAISVLFLVLTIIMGISCVMFIGSSFAWFLGFQTAFFFGVWFLLYKWKTGVNVSYDYCFVSGELRISKVINVNKRKLVARFDCEDIIQVGDADCPAFERFRSDPSTKTVYCTANMEAAEGKFFMYVHANYNGKKLYILECREELLLNMMKFLKRTVLDHDYVMQEKKNK